MRPVYFLLFLAFAVITITNIIYDYQQLHSIYMTGSLLDLGWPLGYLLLGLSARALYVLPQQGSQAITQEKENERTIEQNKLWQILIPYVWIPTIGILLFFIWRRGEHSMLVMGVVVGTAVLLSLLLMRQLVAIRELHALYACLLYTSPSPRD